MVETTGPRNGQARIDVRVSEGRHWVFGVNDRVAKLLLVLNQDGQQVESEIPDWIEPLVQHLGLEGIDA